MNDIEKAIDYAGRWKTDLQHFDDEQEAVDFLNIAISALQQQLTNGWIPVSSRLPENEERVLICADKKSFNGKVVQIRTTAMYEDGTMHTENSGYSWEDNDFEYCEDTDDYIIPEGWFEQNMYCEEFGIVDDFVTHWVPLLEFPKED